MHRNRLTDYMETLKRDAAWRGVDTATGRTAEAMDAGITAVTVVSAPGRMARTGRKTR